MIRSVLSATVGAAVLVLAGCSSSSDEALQPPTYDLVSGDWSVTETVTSHNCGSGPQSVYKYTLNIKHKVGSNSVALYDTRDGSSTVQQATLSGSTLTYSGPRHQESGCSNMTAQYTMTVEGKTSMKGSGSVTCFYSGGSCVVNVNITGSI